MIYKHHPDIAWRKIEDEILMVDPRTGKTYPLNPVAAFIWEHLDGVTDLTSIQEKLLQEFDVSKENANKDMEDFIKHLKSQQLIVEKEFV